MTSGVKISALPPASALTGAEIIPVVQAGMTRRATIADLASSSVGEYPVADFGAVADGVTDDSAAINAAIVAAGTAHGGIVPLAHAHAIANTVVCNYSNVFIRGFGAENNHNVGTLGALAGTTLKWTGAAGGTMMDVASPVGASAQKQRGGGVVGIHFNANGADKGLVIRSWNAGLYEDLFFLECGVSCLEIDVVQTLGDDRNTQRCLFSRIACRQNIASGAGVLLKATYVGGNPSYNLFQDVQLTVKDGVGFDLYNCDNNLFVESRVNATGTGTGIALRGNSVPGGYVARDNAFYGYGSAPIVAYGTDVATYASGYNTIWGIDRGNNTPLPTIGPGARLTYSYTDGVNYLLPGISAVSAHTTPQVVAALAKYASGSTPSHIFVSDGGNQILLMDSASVSWILNTSNVSGDVELRVSAALATSGLNVNPGATGGYKLSGSLVVGKSGQFFALPAAAPANPASGWVWYCDSGDGNKLKAKASTGTVVTLGTP